MICCPATPLGLRKPLAHSGPEATGSVSTALAFDWGKRRIGVALIAKPHQVAIPLKTIDAIRGYADHTQLDALIRDYDPEVFIVGLPQNMNSTVAPETKHAQRFGNHLAKRYARPIAFVDERLTTREAIDRSPTGQSDHRLAALAIAETWIAEQATA